MMLSFLFACRDPSFLAYIENLCKPETSKCQCVPQKASMDDWLMTAGSTLFNCRQR
ncbi:hypothetical protein PS691_04554 [Pseudomonas fluorescens]|uniref:Uncharacterized protein n=1 Tax=Pseudomonas fluorescens TaxID=294 RepID=A0A5E7EGM5_PSEFL|nr:hypothetical protein PS691_04554 [Pseudomonas fluorescens]